MAKYCQYWRKQCVSFANQNLTFLDGIPDNFPSHASICVVEVHHVYSRS